MSKYGIMTHDKKEYGRRYGTLETARSVWRRMRAYGTYFLVEWIADEVYVILEPK